MPLHIKEKPMGPAPKSLSEFLQRYPEFKVRGVTKVRHELATIVYAMYYNRHKLNIPCPVIALLVQPMKQLDSCKNFKC